MCKYEDCEKKVSCRGYCNFHYRKAKIAGEFGELQECLADNCNRGAITRGFCNRCYMRELTAGTFSDKECLHSTCKRPAIRKSCCAAHAEHLDKYGETRDLRFERTGGFHKSTNGYMVRRKLDENGVLKTEREHRLIMESNLGRLLVDGENVHHLNGDRADNRPENLELWNTSQPAGQRVEDKVEYALEMLKLYRPDLLVD